MVTVALPSKRPDSTLESISFLITGTSPVRAGLMVYAMAPSTIAADRVRSARPGFLPQGKTSTESVGNRALIPISCIAVRKLSRAASLAVATATLAVAVPGGISAAQVVAPKPDLKTLVAQAKQLEFQINSLSEQYDGLRIQLTRAQANAKIAEQPASPRQAAPALG